MSKTSPLRPRKADVERTCVDFAFGSILSKKASISIVMPLDVLLRSPPVVCGGIEVSTKVDAYTTNVGARCGGARIRSASVLRFWTMAARWNSSRAPENP